MFNYLPMSEDDCMKEGLLEPGDYYYEVKKSEAYTSRSGNVMIKLTLLVKDYSSSRDYIIYDYIMGDKMAYKLRHLCVSTGLKDKYENGKITPEVFEGINGICEVAIREDKTGKYKPQNAIADYLAQEKKQNPSLKEDPFGDRIPF